MENTILPCFSIFYIAEHGISSRLLEYSTTRADLFAEIGTGLPFLAICGHLDVVSPD